MSPASRSVSSSHSHDRDPISSHSKGSVASSGDDDVDSLQSIHVGSLDRLASKRIGGFPNNRAPAFSKNSTRIFSPSSAPKRSFDSAIHQMVSRCLFHLITLFSVKYLPVIFFVNIPTIVTQHA
jgi:hypothetical protein